MKDNNYLTEYPGLTYKPLYYEIIFFNNLSEQSVFRETFKEVTEYLKEQGYKPCNIRFVYYERDEWDKSNLARVLPICKKHMPTSHNDYKFNSPLCKFLIKLFKIEDISSKDIINKIYKIIHLDDFRFEVYMESIKNKIN